MLIRRLILAVAYNLLVFGGTFFSIAGTFDWWRAWVFIGLLIAVVVILMTTVLRHQPDLLSERMKGVFQRGQPWSDRFVMIAFLFAYGGLIFLTPYDVWRLHTFSKPGLLASSFGMLLLLVGYWIVGLVFQANRFAVPVVKLQTERQHVVIDTGPYAFVRHPMYSGIILALFGMPLWLESYAGALFAIIPSALLAIRSVVEERFLRRELAGYEVYTERTRYRLLPGIW
jgi:protein-S-isoprenylcysteine O-methyltransferase Ste14